MEAIIRPVTKNDIPGIKSVIDSNKLFPSEYLEDMMSDYLNNPESEELWFTKIEKDVPIGVGYCVPEKFTEGTYNLLAIAVSKDVQGKGIGASLMQYIEESLKNKGARVLIVDTSSDDQFELTRKFYLKLGYLQEAVIRDFWSEGDDKVVFWKKLI
ncbi:MAG: hypothetical protein Crog4KO_17500 [Crocinitomicaceae bacterium]